MPVALASPEPLRSIAPSPDGAWLAIVGTTHLFVIDHSDPHSDPHSDGELQIITTADIRDLAWAPDSGAFAVLAGQDALVIATGMPPAIVARLEVGARAAIAMIGDNAYVVGPTGVAMVSRDGLVPRKQLAGYGLGLAGGPRGVIVAGAAQGSLAVMSEAGDPVLAAPSGGLTAFAAAPRLVVRRGRPATAASSCGTSPTCCRAR